MSTEIPTGAESPANLSRKPSDSAALRSSVAGAVMLALSAVSGPAPAQSAPSAPVAASAKAQSPLLSSVPAAGSPERQALEEEMFAAFVAGGAANLGQARSAEYREVLSAKERDKVLAYYRLAKGTLEDPKTLKARTFDILSIFRTTKDIEATTKAYRDTGKLDHATNQKLTALWDRALLAVPSAAGLFDRTELDRIDRLWNSVLDADIARLKEENRKLDSKSADLKAENAQSEKRIKELQELNAIFESIRKTL